MPQQREEDQLYPIAVLIDELRNDDVQNRLNSIKSLNIIALALGEERTRSELIPFLTDTIYDEDEILSALAEKLCELVDLVGGPKHAHCLISPLESLAASEETVVREKAIESLKVVAEKQSPEEFEKHFLPLIQRLATSEWFTGRSSSCSLFPVAYATLPATSIDNQNQLRKMYTELAKDETPMTRRGAATILGPFAAATHAKMAETDPAAAIAIVKDEIIPLFNLFANDDQDSVRLQSITACVEIARLLDNETTDNELSQTMKSLISDKSWRVRYMVAQSIVDLQETFGSELIVRDLIPGFTALLKDQESEVRAQASSKIKLFCLALPESTRSEVVMNNILPIVKELVNDVNPHVKTSLAGVIMSLAPILGESDTIENLLPLFLTQLKDECPDVRLNIISNLAALNDVIGIEQLSQTLLPAITELAADNKWRVRLAILEHMPLLAQQLGRKMFDDRLGELSLSWLLDHVYAIREAATVSVKKLVGTFGSEWAKTVVIPKVLELSEEQNYLKRMTMLFCVNQLLEVLSKETVEEDLIPAIRNLSKDPVANVRFNVAKTLANMGEVVDVAVFESKIKPTLEELLEDSDADVKFHADAGLQPKTEKMDCLTESAPKTEVKAF